MVYGWDCGAGGEDLVDFEGLVAFRYSLLDGTGAEGVDGEEFVGGFF